MWHSGYFKMCKSCIRMICMQIKNISRDDLVECIVSYQTIITTMLYSYSSLIFFIVKGEQDTATKLLYACVGWWTRRRKNRERKRGQCRKKRGTKDTHKEDLSLRRVTKAPYGITRRTWYQLSSIISQSKVKREKCNVVCADDDVDRVIVPFCQQIQYEKGGWVVEVAANLAFLSFFPFSCFLWHTHTHTTHINNHCLSFAILFPRRTIIHSYQIPILYYYHLHVYHSNPQCQTQCYGKRLDTTLVHEHGIYCLALVAIVNSFMLQFHSQYTSKCSAWHPYQKRCQTHSLQQYTPVLLSSWKTSSSCRTRAKVTQGGGKWE